MCGNFIMLPPAQMHGSAGLLVQEGVDWQRSGRDPASEGSGWRHVLHALTAADYAAVL